MIRADIDGLPVQEEGIASFASVNPGVMHACGHDVHTAGLLGVADVLSQRREQLAGEFILLFRRGKSWRSARNDRWRRPRRTSR